MTKSGAPAAGGDNLFPSHLTRVFQLTLCSMNNIWRWLSALFCVYSDTRAFTHNIYIYTHTHTLARTRVYTLGTGCCACPLRRLRDFPLRVRVHSDVSGLRKRNFGKSRRWRYQKHRQPSGRRASQKIPYKIFVVTPLYVTDIRRNTDTISNPCSPGRRNVEECCTRCIILYVY